MLALAGTAWADPAVIEAAQKQMQAGNPKQAYMILAAEQNRLAGNVDFDYLLGVASLDSGKIDEAIIAFERVLAVNPRHAGAQLDLARAYYDAGSLDLAEGTFKQLRESNPPPAALNAIDRYLEAIAEKRKQKRKAFYAWGEASLGYDSNLTGVPKDFTSAVASAFNLQGINPTGNSISRKAPFIGAALGADYYHPLDDSWSLFTGGEVRGRAYRHESPFKSVSVDGRLGALWTGGVHQFRVTATGNRFDQEGDAPGTPKPTNDRRSASVGGDYRYSISDREQLNLGLIGAQTRFPMSKEEDFNSTIATVAWLRAFEAKSAPILQLSTFLSRDQAVRKLPDGVTDKSKRVAGVRSYYQVSLNDKVSIFNGLGYTLRIDRDSFARATEVEHGRDKMADVSIGLNWRFQPSCTMRTQWFYSQNKSNIAIYEYSRHEVSSNIRCDF
jgi:tetratricopeptide (TPR) repeat protein